MKLIRNEKLKQQYKWELRMLPIVILLVVAEFYFCKEKMLIPKLSEFKSFIVCLFIWHVPLLFGFRFRQ